MFVYFSYEMGLFFKSYLKPLGVKYALEVEQISAKLISSLRVKVEFLITESLEKRAII